MHRQSFLRTLTASTVVLGMFVTVLLAGSSIVYATKTPAGDGSGTSSSSGGSSTAKCAILDEGVVDCPSYLGNLGNGTCWYEDPGNPNAGTKAAWEKLDCSNSLFKGAAQAQVTPQEDPALEPCTNSSCNLVKTYVDPIIATLSAGVGLAVTISIVVGGIQYATSAGDPQKAAAAKSRITNSIVALIAFFLLFAALEWLIPGGLLNGSS